MAGFQEWLLEGEVIEERRVAINTAIQTIKDEYLELEQLKLPESILILRQAGVPGGIAIFISQQVSEFKGVWKNRQQLDAARRLLDVSKAGPQSNTQPRGPPASLYRQEFGQGDAGEGGYSGLDSTGYFDNY